MAFLNQGNLDNGVSLEGPILLELGLAFGLALVLALAARFFPLSAAFLVTDFAAVFALAVVAFAFAGAFFTADLAFAGAAFTACFAAVAVFFVATDVASNFLAAAATFFATAACKPALTNLAVPADATLDTVSIFALASFFAVAAPTPGINVNFDVFESFAPELTVSPS